MSNLQAYNKPIINLDKYNYVGTNNLPPIKNLSKTRFSPSKKSNKTRKSPARYVPDIFELTIPNNLLDALENTAPIFFSAYKDKFGQKIKQDKKVIKLASHGKSKTLKGQKALPKKATKLAILRDDYLSDKTPQELYDWWSNKLDKYGMAAADWHMTWPEIEFGFYNQITHLSNSFNKYPPHDGVEGHNELLALEEYLKLVELIIQTTKRGNEAPNYMLIMDAQIAYIKLTQLRHYGLKDCNAIPYFENLIKSTKDKPIILLPQSIFGNIKNFIKFYSIPVIPFLSVYKIIHNGIISEPCSQIRHDLQFHSDKYIQTDLLTLDYATTLIKDEFQKRTQIIDKIINDTTLINGANLSQIFFDDVHEDKFMLYKQIITQQNQITLKLRWYQELEQMYELFITKPGNYLNTNLLTARNKDSLGNEDLYEKYILKFGVMLG